jgi:FixJ family two-component response regulator
MPVDRTSRLIAIIDDDEAMQDSLRDLMEAAELVARCFGSAEEFLESGLHRQAACLISDIRMPKMSGLELQARLKDEECDIPIMFITAHGDARMRIQAMREGAVEFLAKPFDHQLLLKTVRAALDMCIALNSCQSHKANSGPSIEFTHIPPAAQGGRERVDTISGPARNARPNQQIVIYAHSGQWWVHPWPPYLGS